MKTTLHFAILLLAWLVLGSAAAWAQGAAFSCDGTFYQIRQVGTTSSLYRVDRSASTYTTVPVNVRTVNGTPTNDMGVLLNGLAYNSQDGYMYALSTTGSSGTLPTSISMYKIGQGGIVNMGVISGMPNIQVAAGTIDKNGRYYVSSQNSAGTANYNLYRYDLNSATPLVASALRLRSANNTADLNVTFYDLALNPNDNLLYGVFQNGTLWRIDPYTNASTGQALVTVIRGTSINTQAVGTSFFDVAGNLFVYTNGTVGTASSGIFFQVDVNTGAYTQLSTIDPASVSDGASCINPSYYLDVVKSVTNVVRNSATSYTVSFQFKVKNTGTQTLDKVQVSDFLWSGNASTTQVGSTFSGADATRAQSVTVNSLSVTNDGSATLAANTTTSYTGVSNTTTPIRAGLLTGTQSLTAGQSATINLTVTVGYAATTNVPTTPVDNQAYASALGGATSANGGYKLSAQGNLVSPTNGNLQATDASTDSGALPANPNEDSPTPSPIYFQTAILGNVFEDVNYGGGSGRSQATSNGLGVTGARVELFSVSTTNNVDTYTYLQATTSDANGNYTFTTTNGTTALAANTTYAVRVVNNTVVSNRSGGSTSGLVSVQTYRTDVSTATTTPVTDRVGGEVPNKVDYGNTTTTTLPVASTTQAIQSITKVLTPTAGPRLGVDFGYNFDTVVNTNNTGQGSLRQFIVNSNALGGEGQLVQAGSNAAGALPAGKETSIFMIPSGATTSVPAGQRSDLTSGLVNGVAVITPATALPAITGPNTRLDGTTQTYNVGNTNTATLGTSGTVGTMATTFSRVDAPEVEIKVSTSLAGLSITASDVDMTGLALYGSNGNALTISGSNANISNNVLGVTARATTDLGTTARTTGSQISITGGNGTTINNNLVLYAGQSGIVVGSGATTVTITSNEVSTNGRTSVAADGITILGSGAIVTSNLISSNAGNGIDMVSSAGAVTIVSNTISGNGVGLTNTAPTETAGVRVGGSANRLVNNILNANYGAGIMVASDAANTIISQNSTLNNGTITAANGNAATGQLGIDLLKSTDDAGRGTSAYASLNATGKTASSGANGLLNFPVIMKAVVTNTTNGFLQVTGFAPAGSTIEFFLADRTSTAFGQGKTYLFSALEGGTLTSVTDSNGDTGSYSGVINGLDQGSETNATRFTFSLPLSSLTTEQRTAVINASARLTATATASGLITSEFSGNVLIQQNTPLPVELVAFAVQAVQQNAVLSWSTASEKNNAYFVVERSFDGFTFTAVGRVAGQGSTSQAHVYGLVDAKVPHTGTVYYRLRQVDHDGTESLSPVRTVVFTGEVVAQAPTLYPNPTTTRTTLDLRGLATGSYQVSVVDMAGRTVASYSVSGGLESSLDVQQLPVGTYVVLVQGTNERHVLRLVKQ
ncbi:T9SS type A sorting domain-containing protein [Hymenobacter defluvii]|uniref:T9SS type A sorting domain-containing protein n=1 Tax=Hymenobacter defluvii TaxID=2054411 RepID=A0ABS3TC23_9BACT|nr:right-handed parallel beta-helix repeat-containing protein [Hymenobacter defluvii]MBO3271196.1 T9SS type A sorting domain-containing protein [Hymenobacter defluvii]